MGRTGGIGGTALTAFAILTFSLSFPATVWVLDGFGPWTVTGLRGLLAAGFAGAALLVVRAPLPARADRIALAVVAVGCVLGFPLLTTLALQTSSTAHSAVVIGLLPLATTVCSVLRTGERPSRTFWAAAVAGAVVVFAFAVQQSSGGLGLADVYLFGALVLCAAGYAEGGRLARHMPGWQVIAWGVVAAAPVTALISVSGLATAPVHLDARGVSGLPYLAAFSQFLGFVVWYRGMAAIGVPAASRLQLAQPLPTLGWAVLILGDSLTPAMPMAALGVLACIVLTQRTRTTPARA
ncbi:DMT family transporter (plasmid) [Embleya sp. NBC_00888]|uniref:DMT family transporter n=1 Tax=Embleya sp. NBC_00888 TaxID=2975960 RepID=UPI002F91AAE4|nr:DMT family transporter [Embleya sp. NBC_00888]